MAHKPWITAGFITVCCFMSMVSKNFVQTFLWSRKLLCYTQFVMSWISGAYVVIIHGPYLKQTKLLCVVWQYRLLAACPCLSWSVVFLADPLGWSLLTEYKFALARVQIWNPSHPFVQFKFLVYGHKQANKQTYIPVLQCSQASVGLTRFAPIINEQSINHIC